ncbi:hypothetical protein P171DRAFT_480926 [Karstenula rhodostoma CBS 690.94]|uniref:Uncharacterized protein n=1 Tax=Karstenula rhodostoma CBS 690.94 TaxID=1392251 RepID=A0A9P4PVA6_9PLEO|nr:hypothetical protein P171DRAFT_480926 [Karstenula rhodostoma CBS 690.94]
MAHQEDTPMPNAPLTPDADNDAEGSPESPCAEPTSPVIDYSPATIPYSEAFENALMSAVLENEPAAPRTPLPSIPMINPTTLPVPLDSALRTHASPIPGVLLTHANGYHTGGPGPSPTSVEEFARKFIAEEGIVDREGLESAVRRAIEERMGIVRERMEKREEAVKRNRGVQKQLEDLRVQRAAEVSVQMKLKGLKG